MYKKLREDEHLIHEKWQHWKYKNTFVLVFSIMLFIYLAKTPFVESAIQKIGSYGYLGAFFTGIFFVSIFTVAPAAVVLFHLAEDLHVLEVALLAGAGGMVGDYLIFRFFKDKVFTELLPLMHKVHIPKSEIIFKSPYFAWLPSVIGALLIASPVPDEVGIGMLGLTKIRRWQFLTLTFLLNAGGIFLVVMATRL